MGERKREKGIERKKDGKKSEKMMPQINVKEEKVKGRRKKQEQREQEKGEEEVRNQERQIMREIDKQT